MGWKNVDTLNPTLSPDKDRVVRKMSGENEQKPQKSYEEAIKNTCRPLNRE